MGESQAERPKATSPSATLLFNLFRGITSPLGQHLDPFAPCVDFICSAPPWLLNPVGSHFLSDPWSELYPVQGAPEPRDPDVPVLWEAMQKQHEGPVAMTSGDIVKPQTRTLQEGPIQVRTKEGKGASFLDEPPRWIWTFQPPFFILHPPHEICLQEALTLRVRKQCWPSVESLRQSGADNRWRPRQPRRGRHSTLVSAMQL